MRLRSANLNATCNDDFISPDLEGINLQNNVNFWPLMPDLIPGHLPSLSSIRIASCISLVVVVLTCQGSGGQRRVDACAICLPFVPHNITCMLQTLCIRQTCFERLSSMIALSRNSSEEVNSELKYLSFLVSCQKWG